jgi:hypothetical protein
MKNWVQKFNTKLITENATAAYYPHFRKALWHTVLWKQILKFN